jgi:hypothetical protein
MDEAVRFPDRTVRSQSLYQLSYPGPQKLLENVEYFIHLGSVITNDARCTFEINSRIIMAKAALKKNSFHQQIGIIFRKETSKLQHM